MALLAGCGGGGDQSASSPLTTVQASTTPQTSQGSATEKKEAKGTKNGRSREQSGDGSAGHPSGSPTVKVPPISSAPLEGSPKPAPGVKTVKGGDNSVQEYGVEQSSDELTEAAIALQGYLNARVEGDWQRVCSYLAQKPKEQLEKSITSPQGEGPSGCVEIMAALGKGTPQSAAIAEVLSLRGGGDVSGGPSFLIFTAPPGKTLFSMPMYFEGGNWKVGLAQASELPV
jgi:hypothetical protein